MTTYTIERQRTATFTITDCPNCAIDFGVPGRFLDERRKDKAIFYCPNGHGISYKKNEADRLRDQLTQAQDATARAEARARNAENAERAMRGAMTKLRKRTAAGVCPCCHRTFVNMQRHINTKHPEYEP